MLLLLHCVSLDIIYYIFTNQIAELCFIRIIIHAVWYFDCVSSPLSVADDWAVVIHILPARPQASAGHKFLTCVKPSGKHSIIFIASMEVNGGVKVVPAGVCKIARRIYYNVLVPTFVGKCCAVYPVPVPARNQPYTNLILNQILSCLKIFDETTGKFLMVKVEDQIFFVVVVDGGFTSWLLSKILAKRTGKATFLCLHQQQFYLHTVVTHSKNAV